MRILALLPLLLLAFSCEQIESNNSSSTQSSCKSPLAREYSEQISAGEMKVLQGEVKTVIEDHSDEAHRELTIFDTLDGRSYLIDETDPALSTLPRNEMIDLAVQPSIVQAEGAVRPIVRVIESEEKQSAPIDENGCAVSNRKSEAIVAANRNVQTKRIGVFVFNMNKTQQQANDHAKRIADYFNTVGNGKWNVIAEAYLLNLSESTCASLNENMSSCVMQAARTHASNLGKSYNYYTTIQNLRSYGICGHGYMPGSTNWNYCGFNLSVQTHEIGHNHGLGHAAVDVNGSFSEYGDTTSTMGRGSARPTAPHVKMLGVQNENGINNLAATQKVYVHYFASSRSSLRSVLVATLSQGDSYTDDLGFKVDFLAKQEEISEVDIYVNAGDAKPPRRNFPVKGETINIFMSKSGDLTGEDTSFRLNSDVISFRTVNAGANAMGCIAYEAADGSRGNKSDGWCDDLEDFISMETQKYYPEKYRNPWDWDSLTSEWTLTEDLPNTYHFIKGRYWMYFYNPDTEQRDEVIFEVI